MTLQSFVSLDVFSSSHNLSVFPHRVRTEKCCGFWCKKISHLEKFFHSMTSFFKAVGFRSVCVALGSLPTES